MGTAVLWLQEIPDTLENSHLTAKIWTESPNFRHLDFNVLSNHFYFALSFFPLPFLIEETCIIRPNSFQIVQNHVVETVPKT